MLADVLFGFDQSELRPDAVRTLTVALKTLNDSPSIRLQIEGYASPEGSPEYNKALGERRARAVRDYLTSRGIAASRLSVTSYGEERLKYDSYTGSHASAQPPGGADHRVTVTTQVRRV